LFNLNIINKFQKHSFLKVLSLIFLTLFLASLPSLEAPKNIFMFLFVISAFLIEVKDRTYKNYEIWDGIFLSLILSALLSASFGALNGYEWKGFRTILFTSLMGWILYRYKYTTKELNFFYWVTILSIIPPLLWGLSEVFIFNSKTSLQLNSVGHVNHSAIYLTLIYGALVSKVVNIDNNDSTIKKIGLYALTLILFASLVIGESRAAFGCGILISLLSIFFSKKSINKKIMGYIYFSVLLALTVFLNVAIIQKITIKMDGHDILSARDKLWSISIEGSKINPILGLGNGNWKLMPEEKIKQITESQNKNYNPDDFNFAIKHGHPHNLYLVYLAERGIFGLLTLAGFILFWLFKLIKSYPRTKKSKGYLLFWMSSLSAWITVFGIGLVNSTFHHEIALLAFIFLSLQLGYLRLINSQRIQI
jgi:O-antigen ligase